MKRYSATVKMSKVKETNQTKYNCRYGWAGTFLDKSNIHTAYNSAIALVGVHQRNERMHAYKDAYVNVHSCWTYSVPKLEILWTAISRWADKQAVVGSYAGTLFSNKKMWVYEKYSNVDEIVTIMLNARSLRKREHCVFSFV